jgi:hypothetical protein
MDVPMPNTEETVAALLERVQFLEQRANVQPTPVLPVKLEPRVSQPERYSGKRSEFRNFLVSVENMFELQFSRFPNDHIKTRYVGSLLSGSALSWYRALHERKSELLENYAQFMQTFRDAFGDPNVTLNAQRGLRACYQANRSVTTYAAEFQRIANDAGYNDEALASQFRANLNPEIKDHLAYLLEPPKDLNSLIAIAIKIDNRLYERRQERQQEHQHSMGRHSRSSRQQSPRMKSPTSANPTLRHFPETSSTVEPVPMEIDAIHHGRLTQAEKDRRRQHNLCLYCGNSGHIANSCPAKRSRINKIHSNPSTSPKNTAPRSTGPPGNV